MTAVPPPARLDHRFLGTLAIEVERPMPAGVTPVGNRRFDMLRGGTFTGPRLSGIILPGGNDSLTQRADGAWHPDVRVLLETHDGARVLIYYRGIRTASQEVSDRLLAGEQVPWTDYYLRNAPWFETGDPRYAWLNGIMTVGVGRREGMMVIYEIFEIL
ncbi:DUF3237 domain-containing protein [Ruixingdingia sedimenti]|uniref:UPF0311 protein RGD00_14470 n=1 Tax=Ruixingdingia sedimenti TaxID=3073604 RepID=A0ABU1FA96_9RHOB|nr:DUF3237 domain-containing protein [Xinfangfangia sp. LG-4]MDR5653817.1 DUF3237 domain-containing protein [Xinfangfangia sp. LG-4]